MPELNVEFHLLAGGCRAGALLQTQDELSKSQVPELDAFSFRFFGKMGSTAAVSVSPLRCFSVALQRPREWGSRCVGVAEVTVLSNWTPGSQQRSAALRPI